MPDCLPDLGGGEGGETLLGKTAPLLRHADPEKQDCRNETACCDGETHSGFWYSYATEIQSRAGSWHHFRGIVRIQLDLSADYDRAGNGTFFQYSSLFCDFYHNMANNILRSLAFAVITKINRVH